jgi:hypothetical protein
MAKAKTETIEGVKVEILCSIAGVGFGYKKGDVAIVDEATAKDFIQAGYAKEIK